MKPDSKIMWLLERILDYFGQGDIIRQWRDRVNKKIKRGKFKGEIRYFLENFVINSFIDSEIVGGEREEAYSMIIDKNLPVLTLEEKKFILLLALSYYSRKIKDFKDLEEIQNGIMRNINFMGLENIESNDSKKFFDLYLKFKENKLKMLNPNDFFKSSFNGNYEALARDYFDKYYKRGLIILSFPKKERLKYLEEVNKTLLLIIEEGKLNILGLNQEALSKIQKKLSENNLASNVYLILGNKFTKELKQKIKESPHLGGFIAYSDMPLIKREILTGFIVRTKEYYPSPEDFLNKIIRSLIKDDKERIFYILEVDQNKKAMDIFPINKKFKSTDLKECFKAINFLVGKKTEEQSLWVLLSQIDIKLSQILPLLPFTILVKNLEDSERVFIIKNYKDIKEILNIENLQDLSNQEPKDILKAIISKGYPPYNNEEINKLFNGKITDKGIKKRLLDISSEINKNSKRFDWLKVNERT